MVEKFLEEPPMTRPFSQLVFEDNGKEHLTDFKHILDLYQWKKKSQLKMSELDEVSVFRFPSDKEECAAWLRSIPFSNIQPYKEAVLCEQHWPYSYPTVSKKGRLRPRNPPSIWQASLPPSCIPNLPPAPHPTK